MLKKLEKAILLKATEICKERISPDDDVIFYALSNEKKLRNQAITQIADDLCLARGTVTRWMELKNVPPQYNFDILKMCNEDIDYSKFTDTEKDQFFTPSETVKTCYDIFLNKMIELGENIEDYRFIEPAAGAGAFLEVLPEDTIALDIEPRSPSVIEKDYLNWQPPTDEKYIVFGNPPFGLRGHLALKFIDHSYEFADYVCFILPQLFESDGKGSPRKRIKNYNLVHSEGLNCYFHDPDGREMKINVVFQIWSKYDKNQKYTIKSYDNSLSDVYSLSNGISPSKQRNTKMIGKCDFYLPSTCFGKNNMRAYTKFEDLPGKTIHDKKGYGIVIKKNKKKVIKELLNLDWNESAFLSTNSAINLRTSNIKEKIQNIFDNIE